MVHVIQCGYNKTGLVEELSRLSHHLSEAFIHSVPTYLNSTHLTVLHAALSLKPTASPQTCIEIVDHYI